MKEVSTNQGSVWSQRLVAGIATFFGAGLSPQSPGTVGTLATVPLAYLLLRYGSAALFTATVVVSVLGTWAAGRYCAATGKHDNQRIVIDEVAGYLLTLCAALPLKINLLLAFGLFRLLDIWKPWPIRVVDRRVHGGFGVMADDLLAGAIGAVLLYFAQPLLVKLQSVLPHFLQGNL